MIEAKIIYYHPLADNFTAKFDKIMALDDATYDKYERKYIVLCKLLKKPNTVHNMVGIDEKKPSVQLAIRRLNRVQLDITKKRFKSCPIRAMLKNSI